MINNERNESKKKNVEFFFYDKKLGGYILLERLNNEDVNYYFVK